MLDSEMKICKDNGQHEQRVNAAVPTSTESESVDMLPVQNSSSTPVLGTPTLDLPSPRGRYAAFYDFLLENRGAWCPFTFPTINAARSFYNAARMMREASESFTGLETVMRKETIYLRLPAVAE